MLVYFANENEYMLLDALVLAFLIYESCAFPRPSNLSL